MNNKDNFNPDCTELDNIIYLTDEKGQECPFEFLDLVSYEGNEYVILLPFEEEEDSGEVVILQVGETFEEKDIETYDSVDDLDTLNAVFAIFKEKFKDEFNFVD